jgi:hypothetical protein
MKRPMMTATTAMFLGVVTLAPAVVSAAPETRAQERALERLQRAASEHVRILTELSAKLPEQFQADLAPAIGAASQGLAQAQSAVAPAAAQAAIEVTEPSDAAATDQEPDAEETPDDTPDGESPEGDDEPDGESPDGEETPDGDDTPDGETPEDGTTGLVHARERVAAAFAQSLARLNEVMAKVPPQAAEKIAAAIARIQENRTRTLANLDRVMAGEQLVKPERSERPARVERAERPQKPERVERPARPEHPRP